MERIAPSLTHILSKFMQYLPTIARVYQLTLFPFRTSKSKELPYNHNDYNFWHPRNDSQNGYLSILNSSLSVPSWLERKKCVLE